MVNFFDFESWQFCDMESLVRLFVVVVGINSICEPSHESWTERERERERVQDIATNPDNFDTKLMQFNKGLFPHIYLMLDSKNVWVFLNRIWDQAERGRNAGNESVTWNQQDPTVLPLSLSGIQAIRPMLCRKSVCKTPLNEQFFFTALHFILLTDFSGPSEQQYFFRQLGCAVPLHI